MQVGALVTVKILVDVVVPPPVEMDTVPVIALLGTVTVSDVDV